MPYPNEHSARLLSPDIDYIRIRRSAGSGQGMIQGVKVPNSIDVIYFITRSEGGEVPRAQALRFPVSKWTEESARAWLKNNNLKSLLFEPAAEADALKMSFDAAELGKATITQEGYLRAPVTMSRIGVMNYGYAKKVKLPSELFSQPTIDSLRGLPIVEEHPEIDGRYIYVDSSNYREYAKGSISEPEADGKFVKGMATIWDQGLKNKILSGELSEVSLAYSKRDEVSPGDFDGEDFDIIQRNIIGNHLAVTSAGRAGQMVKIEIDSKDLKYNNQDKKMPKFKYVKIDTEDNNKIVSENTLTYRDSNGNDLQVDSDIKSELDKIRKEKEDAIKKTGDLEADNKNLKTEIEKKSPEGDSDLKKKITSLEADLAAEKKISEKLNKDISDQKAEFDSRIDKAIEARTEILKTAEAMKIEVDGKTNEDLKKAVIQASGLDVDTATLKSDIEVDAYYSAATKLVRDNANAGTGAEDEDREFDSDNWKAREKALAELQNEGDE